MPKTVNTVLGPVPVEDLGVTYIHEHLYVKPNELPEYYPYTLDSIEKSIEEAKCFRAAGGSTMVEMTPLNFGRNAEVLRIIAREAGINVICITGFHKQEHLPRWFDEMDDAGLRRVVVDEVEDGIGYSQVKPGAIKIGTSLNQVTGRELRAIEVVGPIAREFQLPVITHCDKGTMALEQIELLGRQGVSPEHICLSHVDIPLDADYLKRICSTGAYVSFDHVGRELNTHDATRIGMLQSLVDAGLGDRVCLAGDMGKKGYFMAYGGKPGLDYILTDLREHTVPVIGEKAFDMMVKDNPQHFLAYA